MAARSRPHSGTAQRVRAFHPPTYPAPRAKKPREDEHGTRYVINDLEPREFLVTVGTEAEVRTGIAILPAGVEVIDPWARV